MVSCHDKDLWVGELESRMNSLLSMLPKQDPDVNRAIESVAETLDVLKDYPCVPEPRTMGQHLEQLVGGPQFGQGGLPEDGPTVLDALVDELVQPGGIVLPGYPEKLPCRCIAFEGKELCTRKGVIGTLTQAQNEQLCAMKIPEADHRLTRLQTFRTCVDEVHPQLASVPEGRERLLYWITHMGTCLRSHGVELR